MAIAISLTRSHLVVSRLIAYVFFIRLPKSTIKFSSRLWIFFFFSSRRRHTRFKCDWSSDVCSSDLGDPFGDPSRGGEIEHVGVMRHALLIAMHFAERPPGRIDDAKAAQGILDAPRRDRKSVV